MEAFAMMGFIFGLSALAMSTAAQGEVKELKDELEGLKTELTELRGGQDSREAE